MAKNKKEEKRGFMDILKEGIVSVFQIISSGVLPSITEGAENILNKVDDRILIMEKRILKKISTFLIIGFGCVFLIFALLFFLKEYLGWNNSAAFFAIGITVFVIGLLLKLKESKR